MIEDRDKCACKFIVNQCKILGTIFVVLTSRTSVWSETAGRVYILYFILYTLSYRPFIKFFLNEEDLSISTLGGDFFYDDFLHLEDLI